MGGILQIKKTSFKNCFLEAVFNAVSFSESFFSVADYNLTPYAVVVVVVVVVVSAKFQNGITFERLEIST